MMQQYDHLKKEIEKKDAEILMLRRLNGELERNQKNPASKPGEEPIDSAIIHTTQANYDKFFADIKNGAKILKKLDDGQSLVEVAKKHKEIKSMYEPSKNMC